MADKNTTDRDIFRLPSRRLQKRVRCQSTIFRRSLFGREQPLQTLQPESNFESKASTAALSS